MINEEVFDELNKPAGYMHGVVSETSKHLFSVSRGRPPNTRTPARWIDPRRDSGHVLQKVVFLVGFVTRGIPRAGISK